jgi:hypothetical protein
MASTVLYTKLGKVIKYAWRVAGDTLSGSKVRAALGIIKAKEGEKDLVFGANSPKPAKVRINFEGGGSTESFCSPDKLTDVTVNGTMNKMTWDVEGKFKNKKISSVTAIQG